MLSHEAGEIYSMVAFAALFVAIATAVYMSGQSSVPNILRNVSLAGLGVFVIMLAADMAFGIVPPSQKPESTQVKTETVPKKPAPPKVDAPEESFYAESYEAIRQATGLKVTERWLLEYGERVTPDRKVDTHGFVEFNDDGVKRQFWLMFDEQTKQCLRVKIDGDLIYTAVGW